MNDPALAFATRTAKFDHVAHACPDITDLLPLYRDVLGGRFMIGYCDTAHGFRVIQLEYEDGSKIELLDPLPGSSFLDRFLARNPSGGMHHITFRVPDLEVAIEAAESAGLEPFNRGIARGRWHEVFLHPRDTNGVLIQLAEAPDDFPPRNDESLEEFLAGGAGI